MSTVSVKVGDELAWVDVPSGALTQSIGTKHVHLRIDDRGWCVHGHGSGSWTRFGAADGVGWVWKTWSTERVRVLALGVLKTASPDELRRLAAAATTVKVGDRVRTSELPSGAIGRRSENEIAMRQGDRGEWIKDGSKWSRFGERIHGSDKTGFTWDTLGGHHMFEVLALGVAKDATVDELRRVCGEPVASPVPVVSAKILAKDVPDLVLVRMATGRYYLRRGTAGWCVRRELPEGDWTCWGTDFPLGQVGGNGGPWSWPPIVGELEVAAVGVPMDATADDLRKLAKDWRPGDTVEWDDVPDGALALNETRDSPRGEHVLKVDGKGWWVGGGPASWERFGCGNPANPWAWGRGLPRVDRVKIVALDVKAETSTDDLRRIVAGRAFDETRPVAAKVGDMVAWKDVPDGALCVNPTAHGTDSHRHVLRAGTKGKWVEWGAGWEPFVGRGVGWDWDTRTDYDVEGKLRIVALGVAKETSIEDLKRLVASGSTLVSAAKVGDDVDWDAVPSGALVRAPGGHHALRSGDRGWYVSTSGVAPLLARTWWGFGRSQDGSATAQPDGWGWTGYGSGPVKIVALSVPRDTSADELKRLAGAETAVVKAGDRIAADKVPVGALVEDDDGDLALRSERGGWWVRLDDCDGVEWRPFAQGSCGGGDRPWSWSELDEDEVRVIATGIAEDATTDELRVAAGCPAVRVGDRVNWLGVPSGALVLDSESDVALRNGKHGSWVRMSGDWTAYEEDWEWNDDSDPDGSGGSGKVTILALGVFCNASVDDLCRLAGDPVPAIAAPTGPVRVDAMPDRSLARCSAGHYVLRIGDRAWWVGQAKGLMLADHDPGPGDAAKDGDWTAWAVHFGSGKKDTPWGVKGMDTRVTVAALGVTDAQAADPAKLRALATASPGERTVVAEAVRVGDRVMQDRVPVGGLVRMKDGTIYMRTQTDRGDLMYTHGAGWYGITPTGCTGWPLSRDDVEIVALGVSTERKSSIENRRAHELVVCGPVPKAGGHETTFAEMKIGEVARVANGDLFVKSGDGATRVWAESSGCWLGCSRITARNAPAGKVHVIADGAPTDATAEKMRESVCARAKSPVPALEAGVKVGVRVRWVDVPIGAAVRVQNNGAWRTIVRKAEDVGDCIRSGENGEWQYTLGGESGTRSWHTCGVSANHMVEVVALGMHGGMSEREVRAHVEAAQAARGATVEAAPALTPAGTLVRMAWRDVPDGGLVRVIDGSWALRLGDRGWWVREDRSGEDASVTAEGGDWRAFEDTGRDGRRSWAWGLYETDHAEDDPSPTPALVVGSGFARTTPGEELRRVAQAYMASLALS